MKNLWITSVFSLLMFSPAFAQKKMQKSVTERATEKVANLDKELQLSDAQKKELQVYFEEEMNQMADTRSEQMNKRKEMRKEREEMSAKRSEMRERRAQQRESMTERRDNRMERMKQILTPEQYETWLSTRTENREDLQRNGRARSEMNQRNSQSEGENKRTRARTRGQR